MKKKPIITQKNGTGIKNILHLINVRWYNACAYYAVALAAAQKKSGYDVMLAGDPNTPSVSVAAEMALEFDQQPRLSSYWPVPMIKNMLWLKKMVLKNDYEVVVAHRGEAHTVAVLTKKLMGIDFILVRVRGDVRPPRYDMFNKFLYNEATDGVICSTEKLRDEYSKYFNIDSERIISIPAGIDIEYFSNIPPIGKTKRKFNISENDRVITLLGRLSPIKGHKDFIKAAGYISQSVPNVNFLIAGQEFEVTNKDLRRWINRYCSDAKFSIIGLVDDVREILSITDIAVIPSLGSEMIARVAMEFMAAGKSVIASKINALEEIVENDKGGYLFEAGNVEQLSAKITALLNDPAKMMAFGEYNFKLARQRYSSQKWAEDSIIFYNKLKNLKNKRSNG